MKNLKLIQFSCICLLMMMSFTSKSQVKTGKQDAKKTTKQTTLKTCLDKYSDSVVISAAEVVNLIKSPLKIIENNKTYCKLINYKFLYKEITYGEDEKSGKVIVDKIITSDNFRKVPLPNTWIEKIKQDVKPGDELLFFDIIIEDANHIIRYAPDLKIIIH